MNWSQYATMDPHLLVGLVNTELRNHSDDLNDLCRTHDIDQDALVAHLAKSGYDYFPEQGKFR
ncbi:MAG: DUF4250 domain-containing protein [Lentimonas sp.]